jgi:hypothetical protein
MALRETGGPFDYLRFEAMEEQITDWKHPRIAGHEVWHIFSAPNGADEIGEFCDVCGFTVKRQVIDKARSELYEHAERGADYTWPQPLYRAIETMGASLVCPPRLQQVKELLQAAPTTVERKNDGNSHPVKAEAQASSSQPVRKKKIYFIKRNR